MQNDAWQTREILSTSVQSCRLCLHCHLHMINNFNHMSKLLLEPTLPSGKSCVCTAPFPSLHFQRAHLWGPPLPRHLLSHSCSPEPPSRADQLGTAGQMRMYMSVLFSYDTCSLSLRPLIPSSSFYLLFRTQRTHARNAIKWVGDPSPPLWIKT